MLKSVPYAGTGESTTLSEVSTIPVISEDNGTAHDATSLIT